MPDDDEKTPRPRTEVGAADEFESCCAMRVATHARGLDASNLLVLAQVAWLRYVLTRATGAPRESSLCACVRGCDVEGPPRSNAHTYTTRLSAHTHRHMCPTDGPLDKKPPPSPCVHPALQTLAACPCQVCSLRSHHASRILAWKLLPTEAGAQQLCRIRHDGCGGAGGLRQRPCADIQGEMRIRGSC